MAELKTKPSDMSVAAFLASIADPATRTDAERIDAIMREVSGGPGKLWGSAIVGYGDCHMVYESGRELDWFLVGFSPRKANLTLYIMPGFADYDAKLAELGKHSTGKSCLYVKKLADVDEAVLRELVEGSVEYMRAKYGGVPAVAKKAAKKPAAKKPAAKKTPAKKAAKKPAKKAAAKKSRSKKSRS
ncbi:DUF1801 domain-containing protein [Nannocystaceae bacterium ST9]